MHALGLARLNLESEDFRVRVYSFTSKVTLYIRVEHWITQPVLYSKQSPAFTQVFDLGAPGTMHIGVESLETDPVIKRKSFKESKL